ncbi:low molecular weight phosphotyrosine protein phosphatase [Paenibacillus sp. J5C_2022]|uniref:low molecular weight protein-tyrosine-phosphatase n=1 Tax=Paenibacillus sp. J5C2022 TaxID=2977129 RepID=UPI0021CF0A37|nr:low molecular weight protein-tyrosine-phosphatase [Paenibacillus sp. J5C2022]MCU6708183.1 low molecular weight phosphotyrosine protein phosphatase [Paenibacillus sp. J5C2022]
MKNKSAILFVCLGNICRSPMAEAVMREMIAQAGLSDVITVDSAGTGDWHIGRPPHEGTQGELKKRGISFAGMKARQVTANDFASFRYMVAMDTKNLADVRGLQNNVELGGLHDADANVRLFTFMELLPQRGIADVPDPYYEGNFPYVYELVEEGCRELLRIIKADLESV